MSKEKDFINVEIELAKSWFVLSQTLLTIVGFLFLIYILSFNVGFSLAKMPLDIYLESSGDFNSTLLQELEEAKPELNKTIINLKKSQEIIISIAIFFIMFAFLFWGLGRENLERILIKNKLSKPKKKIDGRYFFWMSLFVAALGIIGGFAKGEWVLVIVGVVFIPISITIWKKNKKERLKKIHP